MWMVRAGRGGDLFDGFMDGHVAVGFGGERLGPVQDAASRADLIERYKQAFPSLSDSKAVNAASQLYRFHHEMREGDSLLTYDPSTRRYVIGTFSSSARFDPEAITMSYRRSVEWQSKVSRDSLSVGTRNSLGSTLTIFQIPDEAAAELRAKLRPLDASDEPDPSPEPDDPAN